MWSLITTPSIWRITRHTQVHAHTDFAFAHHLVDELAVGIAQCGQVHWLGGQALACALQCGQRGAQHRLSAQQLGDLFALGQHGRAPGLHALRHDHVIQHVFVFRLGARADGHDGNGERLLGVHPGSDQRWGVGRDGEGVRLQ